MAKISLKKDYMDGNVLYGKDLNPNFETIETTINANDEAQSETNASVNEALTQLSSDVSQAKTDISTLQGDVADLETAILDIPTKTSELVNDSGFITNEDIPTKISELENDDNTVKDAEYVHTDNNYTDEDKTKLTNMTEYKLPVATSSTLGGVMVGPGLNIGSNGSISLGTASATRLGGVKAGDGVQITADGSLNVIGGSTGDGIPTITGTQEDPIPLYNFTVGDRKVPIGLAYISGYTKEISTSEANDNYNRNLLYTSSNGFQFIGPYYERYDNGSLNLVFWFRPRTVNNTPGFFTEPFVKYSANEIITNTEQGYVTPKAVYDYVGALTSLNTTDKTSIVNAINELVNSAGTPGEDGATFTPSVDDSGNLSWTNDKGLPNPDPVNIKGPKGDTGDTGPQGNPGEQGEVGPQGVPGQDGTDGVTPTIGENGNWYLGETDTGKPSRGEKGEQGAQGLPGPTGPGVPTGGTTGQVLSKNSDSDYDTAWVDAGSGGSGIIELIGTDEEPIDFINGMQEEGIYLVSGKYYKTIPDRLLEFSSPVLCFITRTMTNVGSSLNNDVMRFIFNFNGGPSLEASSVTKGSSQTVWNIYKLNPVSSFRDNGMTTEAVSTYMFKQYTGLNGSTNIKNLQTTDKSSLVAAINELNTRLAALENPTE